MSSTVDTYLEEVKKHRKALARLVEKLEECEDDDQARRLSDSCAAEIEEYKRFMNLARDEISSISSATEQDKYNNLRKQQKKKFKKVESKFKELDNHARDRRILLDESGRKKKKKPRTNRDYGEEGVELATSTTDRLRDALGTVRQAHELGTATAAELIEQGQQIERIHAEVQGIDQDLNRADKLITQFMKRLYTDKIILAMACLVFCAIAFIIVYATFIDPDQDTFSVPDAVKPPDANQISGAAGTVTSRLLRGGAPAEE